MSAPYRANILVVDDNLDNLNLLSRMLAEHQLQIRRAISGTVALRTIEAKRPDLILLDIQLPDLSGYEICRHLKRNPTTQTIPIIFISALDSTFDKVKAFELGGVDYITKPFALAEVKARIDNQLQLQVASAEVERLNAQLEDRVHQRTAQLTAAKIKLERQIQERRVAEAALQQSERRFRALIENTSDLILLLDSQGGIHYASPSVERQLGVPPVDLLGQSVVRWMHPQDQESVTELLRQVLTCPGQALTETLRWHHHNDHWSVCETTAQHFIDPSGFSGIAVNARDMTERLRGEAIQRALDREKELGELKLRFFSMTSHEFRTPLSVILMAAQILEDLASEAMDAKRIRNIRRIQTSAQHMKQMLADVLDIARLEAKQMEFKPEPMDLNMFCDRILETQQTYTNDQPRIHFLYKGPLSLVHLDPHLLQSILTNLLTNALKYSAREHPVKFQVEHTPDQVEFTIADRGIGIPQPDKIHLFQSFHRGDNVGEIEGSGLGLTIVKKCINLHQGQISIDSVENQGTTVRVTLPLQPSPLSTATVDVPALPTMQLRR